MTSSPVKLAIVGLGRRARVLTRASAKSEKLKIPAAVPAVFQFLGNVNRDAVLTKPICCILLLRPCANRETPK